MIEEKLVVVKKIKTADNPADAFTKTLPVQKFELCMSLIGIH